MTIALPSGIGSVTVPTWISDLAWGTTYKFASRIILINECIGLRLHCTEDQIASGQCLVQTGEELLELVGWKDWRTGRYCALLMTLTVLYRLVAWGCIRLKVSML